MSASYQPCPVCNSKSSQCHDDNKRIYLICNQCFLVFVPEEYHLSEDLEKKRYELHQNTIKNQGYCSFLNRLVAQILSRVPMGSYGLDFGCGPSPVLSQLLIQQGYKITGYDKYFLNNISVLDKQYDFITATEVLEHVAKPKEVCNTLYKCLKPGGVLAIMTQLNMDRKCFSNWHYISDLTHVSFYGIKTMEYIADLLSAQCSIIGKDIILFIKN